MRCFDWRWFCNLIGSNIFKNIHSHETGQYPYYWGHAFAHRVGSSSPRADLSNQLRLLSLRNLPALLTAHHAPVDYLVPLAIRGTMYPLAIAIPVLPIASAAPLRPVALLVPPGTLLLLVPVPSFNVLFQTASHVHPHPHQPAPPVPQGTT
jgi:hypothetical protein